MTDWHQLGDGQPRWRSSSSEIRPSWKELGEGPAYRQEISILSLERWSAAPNDMLSPQQQTEMGLNKKQCMQQQVH